MIPNTMKASGKPNLSVTVLRRHRKLYRRRIGNVIGNLQKCTKATGKGYAYGFYAATLILWDLFEENDKRRDLSIAPYWYDVNDNKKTWTNKQIVQRSCGKFRREWETSSMKEKSYTPETILFYVMVMSF